MSGETMAPNPIQSLLRREMGIDAFGLDGDDTDVPDTWFDRARPLEPDEVRLVGAVDPRRR